jgi:hypothetical protein
MKLGWFFTALTNMEENRYRQIALGTADESMLGLTNDYLSFRGFQEWWDLRLGGGQDARKADFVQYLTGRIEEARIRGGPKN